MKKLAPLLFILIGGSSAYRSSEFLRLAHIAAKFNSWMDFHSIKISSESEYQMRLEIFAHNDEKIKQHNSGNATYKLDHNQFSYYTEAEFKAIMGAVPPAERKWVGSSHTMNYARGKAPENVDWTTVAGAVTHIRNQGQCGSCWAFATAGAVEGAHFLKTKQSVDLSEQELIDCDKVDAGCNGGWMDNAYQWIEDNGGLCKEDDYPYVGHLTECKVSACETVKGTKVAKWIDIQNDEEALKDAVAQQPVAAAIEASTFAFQFYKSGVFTGECSDKVDHGILIVGYGKDAESGIDFWKIKNSWGPQWGDQGYIRIQMGISGTGKCGIASNCNYPVIE